MKKLILIFVFLFAVILASGKADEAFTQANSINKQSFGSDEYITAENTAKQIQKDYFSYVCTHNSADSITYIVFQINGGWGYDIYIDGKKYIHQQSIPAINGNIPFKTKEDAEKTVEFVITKIKRNIMPPSVTHAELDSLGVFN